MIEVLIPSAMASRLISQPRWALVFRAAIVAALAAILLGNLPSASAASRVGVSSSSVEVLVGASDDITAGQRLGNDATGPGIVVATGVAANTESSFMARLNAPRDERGAIGGWGRGGQKLSPDPDAGGYAHSTFRRGPDGTITHYAEWTPNARSPRGYDLVQRFDGVGGAHYDKSTGAYIPTPHMQGNGWVRPALPWEIPR